MTKNKQFALLVAIVLVVAGVVLFGGGGDKTPVAPIEDHVKGGETAIVSIVEYSDFQCPACAAYYPAVKQLLEEFDGQVSFSYKHFPLNRIHINADLAARATEAAGLQGKFWEMHDMIFENQKTWSDVSAKKIFVGYAEELGIDTDKFKDDLSSKEVRKKVQNDYDEGIELGVSSTPSFFFNGEKIENPQTYEEFKALIQTAVDGSGIEI